jgi:hypothetical protein
LQRSAGITLGDASFGSGPGDSFLVVTGTVRRSSLPGFPGLGSIVPLPVSTPLQSIAAGNSSQFFEIFGASGNQLFDEGTLSAPFFNTVNSYTGTVNDNFTELFGRQ